MAEVEAPPEAPAWMLALEKKRQRVHRLAHEVGAGSPCLLCKDDCPGLDLHFWRKICRNCKCKKEDHDVIDDCGFEQFEILLGSGHSMTRPNKAFLEMLEKHTIAGLKSKANKIAFDWIPPDVSPVIAAEYMESLPASKLPISGSDGALYRRQQLERQLPLHDLDANQCHQLTDAEKDNLNKYLENLKNNVVGQGRVTKLHIPSSNSLDSLQKICTYNSVPKPFQPSSGSACPTLSSESRPEFKIGGNVGSGQPVHLKPPSAFWPKSLSPEPPRSVSPSVDDPLPSIADRGAAFGVTLSPASQGRRGFRPSGKGDAQSPPSSITQQALSGKLIKDQLPKSIAGSTSVPGNMWVPAECPECSKKGLNGQLVKDELCTHLSISSEVPQTEPSVCAECERKGVGGILVRGQFCPHIATSIEVPCKPAECSECLSKGINGKFVEEKICSHHRHDSSVPLITQPLHCPECVNKAVDGTLVIGQVCSHVASSTGISVPPAQCLECSSQANDGYFLGTPPCPHVNSDIGQPKSPNETTAAPCTKCISKSVDGRLVKAQVCSHFAINDDLPTPKEPGKLMPLCKEGKLDGLGRSTMKGRGFGEMVPQGMVPHQTQQWDGASVDVQSSENMRGFPAQPSVVHEGLVIPPDLKVPSPVLGRNDSASPPGRNRSPSNVSWAPGAPNMMALYAHNAMESPSSLEPQDALSPHVASMSIDESTAIVNSPGNNKLEDGVPVIDLKLHCAQCREDIVPGEVVVFADRAGLDVMWHPKCFVCNSCQELLVDLVYFYNKGHVYCGRHYAEILDIPRCSACDELIFVKEYTVAEGQAFHVKHFCCFECDIPLGGQQYVPKDGQPVCLPCYERKYGKQCETCHQVIGAKDQGVTWKNLHWHASPDCFCCFTCQKSLLGGRFAVRDQLPFCSKECMQAAASNHQKVSAI